MSDSQPQGEVMPPIEGEGAHESMQIRAKSIVLFALGLVVLGLAIHVLLGWVMGRFVRQEVKIEASKPPLFAAAVDYSGPHLQGDPAADRIRIQKQQLGQLSSYGWVDRKTKIVHIPIDRAMDLLAESTEPELLNPEKTDTGTAAVVPGDREVQSRPADRQPPKSSTDQGTKR